MIFELFMFWLALVIGVAAVVAFLTAVVVTLSVVFAKGAMCLLAGAVLSGQYTLVQHGWLNFLLFTAISAGVMMLLSLFPSLSVCIRFCSTGFICILATMLVVSLLASMFAPGFMENSEQLRLFSIITKVVACGVALVMTYIRLDLGQLLEIRNPIVMFLQRVAASGLFGLCMVLFALFNLNGSLPVSVTAQYLIFGGTSVAYFFFDWLVISRRF